MDRDSYLAHLRLRRVRARYMRFVMHRSLRATVRWWHSLGASLHLRPFALG